MRIVRNRWLWLLLVLLVCLGVYVVRREVDRANKEFMESKLVRTSPATIIRKASGTIYYRIDSFDNLPEPRRSRAIEAEHAQFRESGARAYPSLDWYDQVEVGSRIYVRYQCFSDGKLLIVGVEREPPPLYR